MLKSTQDPGLRLVHPISGFSHQQNFVKKVCENILDRPKRSDRCEAIDEESDVDSTDWIQRTAVKDISILRGTSVSLTRSIWQGNHQGHAKSFIVSQCDHVPVAERIAQDEIRRPIQ
jgi:hypothetical protein